MRPLHERAREPDEVAREKRLCDEVPSILLARGDDHRRARGACVRQVAEPVREPGDGVQIHEARAPGQPAVRVRHPHRGRLLEREHVLRLVAAHESVHERQLGRAGIPEHVPDALVGERFEQDLRPRPPHSSNYDLPTSLVRLPVSVSITMWVTGTARRSRARVTTSRSSQFERPSE